jgi:hypothetical protein
MNGFEKYKNTCIAIIFAWKRGFFKGCHKDLMKQCIKKVKIDLSGNQYFPQVLHDVITHFENVMAFENVLQTPFTLLHDNNNYNYGIWNVCSVAYSFVIPLGACYKCKYPITFKQFQVKTCQECNIVWDDERFLSDLSLIYLYM